MIFEESRLKFEFDDHFWKIVQYDAHPDYKTISNKLQGTKAIDFLGFYRNSLIMFEVKNFRGFGSHGCADQRLANNMDELSTEVARKIKDTIAVITGLGRARINEFWIKVFHHIAENHPITIIAWVEEDINKREKNKMSVRRECLAKKLNWLTHHVYLDNIKERHFHFDGFSVSHP